MSSGTEARTIKDILARLDHLEALSQVRGVRARVFNSANILIVTGGAGIALTYDSERYDTDGFHSTLSVTTRLTAPFDGYYAVGAAVRFASNAVGYRQVFLRINGATVIASLIVDAVGTTVTDIVLGDPVYFFNAGDYVECMVVQTSGGNLNVLFAANLSPEFWIEKLID